MDEQNNNIPICAAGNTAKQMRVKEAALPESEALYRTLFETAPLGLGIADTEGNFIAFNDSMLKPGGYTREDIVRIGNVTFLYADTGERAKVLALARKQGFLHRHEVQFKRKDGTCYYALLSLTPVKIKGKQYWQAMVEDITERKRTEEELHFRSILLDSARDSIFVLDREGRVIYVNEAAYKDRGFTKEELIGKPIDQVDAPQYKELVRQRMAQLLKNGSIRVETAHLKKDGTLMDVEVNAQVSEFGGRIVIVGILRDITERKRAEDEIKKYARQLEDSNRMKGCQQRNKIPQIQRFKFPHPLIKFPLNFLTFYQEVNPTFVELPTHVSYVL